MGQVAVDPVDVSALIARMTALEDMVSTVDKENLHLRGEVARLDRQLSDASSTREKALNDEVQRLVKLEMENRAFAKTTEGTQEELNKRLANVERVVARDDRALADVIDQVKVFQKQGLGQGTDPGAVATAAAAAAAAAAGPSVDDVTAMAKKEATDAAAAAAADVEKQLVELRAALREKSTSDAAWREKEQKKSALMFNEIVRLTNATVGVEGHVAQATGESSAAMGQVAAVLEDRVAQLEKRQATAEHFIGSLEGHEIAKFQAAAMQSEAVAARLATLAEQHNTLKDEIEAERRKRAETTEAQNAFREELKRQLSSADADVSTKLGSLLSDVNSKILYEGQSLDRRRREDISDIEKKEAARIEADRKAFSAVAERFERLSAELNEERGNREELSRRSKRALEDAIAAVGEEAKVADERVTEEFDRVRGEMKSLAQAQAQALEAISSESSRERDALSEVVRTEIDSRVKAQRKLKEELERYMQGLTSAIEKVRSEAKGGRDVLVRRHGELHDDLTGRMAEVAANAKEVARAVEASVANTDAELRDHVERVRGDMRDELDADLSKREAAYSEMLGMVERNAAATADAVAAMQTVASEDRQASIQAVHNAREAARSATDSVYKAVNAAVEEVKAADASAAASLAERITAAEKTMVTSIAAAAQKSERRWADVVSTADRDRADVAAQFALREQVETVAREAEAAEAARRLEATADELRGEIGGLQAQIDDADAARQAAKLLDGAIAEVERQRMEHLVAEAEAAADRRARRAEEELSRLDGAVTKLHRDQQAKETQDAEELAKASAQLRAAIAAAEERLSVARDELAATVDADRARALADEDSLRAELQAGVSKATAAVEGAASELTLLRQQADDGAATLVDLVKRVGAVENGIVEDRKRQDAAWEQSLALASEFEGGEGGDGGDGAGEEKPRSAPRTREPAKSFGDDGFA